MFRFVSALAALSLILNAVTRAQTPPQETALPPPGPLPVATVYTVKDSSALDDWEENVATERRMVDRLVLAVTGQTDLAKAWQTLVRPTDRVGIKVAATGGKYFSSHRGVVAAIVSGLESAGVPASKIVIWDRWSAELRSAGFTEGRAGCEVSAIDPPRGFDSEVLFTAPMLGKLIWGDLLFRGRDHSLKINTDDDDSQITAQSHLATILTHGVTRIINVATLSDERGCGVAGALYNVTVPNVDNWRRFVQGSGSSSICDLYADARIRPKVALNIIDGLVAQYAGGPSFEPNFAIKHHTLYASKDPVALDSTILRILEVWRSRAKLPAIGDHADWLKEAQSIGLGIYEADRIRVQAVGPTLQ